MKKKIIWHLLACLLFLQGCSVQYTTAGDCIVPIWAIDSQFSNATTFSSGVAFIEQNSSDRYFINAQNEEVFDFPLNHSLSSRRYKSSVMENGVAFLQNEVGQKVILSRNWTSLPMVNDSYVFLDKNDGKSNLYAAKNTLTGSYGYLNQQSLWFIEPKYRSTSPFYLGQSIACDDNSSYSVDDFGEITKINALGIPESIYQDTVLVFSTDGYFFADKSGTPMFNSVFEEALPFREGLAAVKENEKWGYIDTEGNTVISFEFAKAYSFSGGYAFVENEKGRLAIIDKNGRLTSKYFKAEWCGGEFSDGLAVCASDSPFTQSYGLVDTNGQWIVSPKYKMIYEHENCYVLEKDDKYGLYLPLAEKEIATKYRWIDVVSKELAIVSTKYSSRLLSLVSGEMQGGEFFDLDSYSEGLFVSQLLEVSKTGTITRVGFVDETGSWIIAPQFEEAKAFSNGLAAVKQEGKWGYIANPLIYKEWISDELLRGQSLGLFTAKNGTSATMNALLPMLSNLIEKIDGSKLNSDELLSALKLNENLEVDNNTPLTRQDACVALASVAEYLGENVYCLFAFLTDESEVDEQYIHFVNYAMCMGLLDCDKAGVFNPQSKITSEEMQKAVLRLYEGLL